MASGGLGGSGGTNPLAPAPANPLASMQPSGSTARNVQPVFGRVPPAARPQRIPRFYPGQRAICQAKAASGKSAVAKTKPGRGRPSKTPPPPEQPIYPEPGLWQQTLWRSFTAGGIGLHSGEVAYVRVRPAYAGEGRYFVRVPEGSNCELYKPPEGTLEQLYPPPREVLDEEAEDQRVEMFLDYMDACDKDEFEGTFTDFVLVKGYKPEELAVQIDPGDVPEAVKPRSEDEEYVPAHIDHLSSGDNFFSVSLGEGRNKVVSVEHLLSALEACGVDNARIEIEGGPEVPVLDGSALGWVLEIQNAGLTTSVCWVGDGLKRIRRAALKVDKEFTVRDGQRFVTIVPDDRMKLTYGIDHSIVAPVIGKQWHTWCLQEDPNYKLELASARMYYTCIEELQAVRDAGYVQGGTEGIALIGHRESWWEADSIRYYPDEPVRHKLVDLIGDLSLLSLGGMSGLPYGHIVAYRANHELHLRFVRELKEHLGEAYYEGYESDPKISADVGLDDVSARIGKPIAELPDDKDV